MKKIIILLFLLPINVFASTLVMDADINRVLYEDGGSDIKLIASTTKIMTALVVIRNTNLNDVVEVDENVLKSEGSNIYITIGEHIKVIDLLYGLLLRSGNDAAIILANYVGGSMDGFVLMMNNMAKSLDMNNTKFINSSGLEVNGVGNTSTPYDMALLMSYAIKNDIFKKITSTKKYEVKTDKNYYVWYNKNKLLNEYKYCTGGKTGYTKKAYRTLVTTASKNNKNLVIVTLNENDDFNKHKTLYEEYLKKYKNYYINNDLVKNIHLLLTKEERKRLKMTYLKTNDVINRKGIYTISLDSKELININI